MKKLILFGAACAILFSIFSCTKATMQDDSSSCGSSNLFKTDFDAMETFGIALTKALEENQDLRAFIKAEALSQFDKDYDVFYPFVKNKEVITGKTFRDILLDFISENELSEIEFKLPLLNMLVPDLTWCSGFSARTWDISDNVVALAIVNEDSKTSLYAEGRYLADLETNEIPGFPVIVLKNNERLVVTSAATKGGDFTYDFVDPVFNGTIPDTKGVTPVDSYIDLPVEEQSDYVPASMLDSRVIQAYNLFKGHDEGAQRDYIYYGMTPTKTTGVLNNHIRERILRFKIEPSENLFEVEDPGLSDPITVKKAPLSNEEIIAKAWTDGNFELHFDVYRANRNNGTTHEIKVFNVYPCDLFDFTRVKLTYKHPTWFSHSVYTYTFDAKDLVSKWYYVDGDVLLDKWDISKESTELIIIVTEKDNGTKYTYTTTHQFDFSDNFDLDGNIDVGTNDGSVKVGLGISYGASSSSSRSETLTIERTEEDDVLGSNQFNYTDAIITGKNSKGQYNLFSLSTGVVKVTLLPEYR